MSLPTTIRFAVPAGYRDMSGRATVNGVQTDLLTWTKQPSAKMGEVVYLPDNYFGYASFSKLVLRAVLSKGQLVVTAKLFLAPSIEDTVTTLPIAEPEKAAGYMQLSQEIRVPVQWDRTIASQVLACFCSNIVNPAIADTKAEVDALIALTTNMLANLSQGSMV